MLEVNDNNGDFYIGTSEYTTNGTIYRFKKDGTFIEPVSYTHLDVYKRQAYSTCQCGTEHSPAKGEDEQIIQ